jgi:pilus assembly protein Flp/PilA
MKMGAYLSGLMWSWRRDVSGATAIEYGLIAAGISLAIAAAVLTFGDTLNELFFVSLIGALDI